MRPERSYGAPASPPRETHARVFGYNLQTGETVLPRTADGQHRPVSRGRWDFTHHQSAASVSSRSTDTPLSRLHPDHTRPTLSQHRYGSYSDSLYQNQSNRSVPVEAAPQVALLEEQVRKLTATLNEERAGNARSHLNTTSYMLQLLEWINGQTREWDNHGSDTTGEMTDVLTAPNPAEVHTLRDNLTRQSIDLRHNYETFMASDALASLAGAGMNIRDSQPRPGKFHSRA